MNKNKEKITSITSITMLLLALMPYMDNATTPDNRLTNRPNMIKRSLLRQMLSLIFSMIIFISIAVSFVPVASASGGAYTLKWYAADPEVNKAPYLPAYEKLTPSQLACPGTDGRYPDPLNDSVAYGPTYNSSNLDAVTSLAPKDMALGQIVPFEVEIAVNGDTGPENGTINFTGGWNTNTTSSDDFGYDSAFMVYCAFVDTADPGTIDPGNNAKVDSFTSELANPGTKDEEIQGTFQISGLDNGDNVIVEVWVVLKPTIPSGSTGNVQSRLVSAQTVATEPDDINTGNQIIPLLQVQEFFSADADISVNKTDSPDPVTRGQYLNYTLLVKNNSPDTIANGINVTDTLDPNTTFVSASGAPYNNTTSTVTFNVGALSPGQNVTLFINTTVSDTAPIDNDTSENPEAGSATLPTISYDLLNSVSVASITDDSNTTNNTYYQPTNVLPAFEPSATLTLLKQISNSSTGPWSSSITVPGGSPVYYNFTVINTGNVPLSSLSINDSLVNTSGITPPWPEPLEVLTSASRIVGPVTAETLAGTYPNTATANGTYESETKTSDPSSAEYIVAGAPAYTIDKIVTDVADKGPDGNVTAAGDVIEYQITVNNTGNVDLTNITVNDTLIPDANLTGPTGDNAPTGVLDIGETWTYTGTYTATQADINSNGGGDGLINNTATVDSDQLPPKEDTAQVPIAGTPSYTIDKTVTDVAGKGTTANVTKAGEVITYQITVNNTGNVDLTNVTVNDTLIGNLTGPTESKNEDGILEVGETWIFTGNYTVTHADINSNVGGDGFINNTATVDSDELEPLSDSETVPIEQNPAYTIDKIVTDVAGQGPTGNVTAAGDVIEYQITVNNTGNVDLTNITVNDPLLGTLTGPTGDNPVAGVLEVGEIWVFTGNYTVTSLDINNNGGGDGDIDNTATVDSDQLPPEEDTADVPIAGTPSYTIDKTVTDVAGKGPAANVTKAGDVITYQINVTNTGNVDLTNVTVTDSLIENLTDPSGDNPVVGVLEVGETWTYTGTYTVTQADINSNGGGDGLINNTATIDSDQLPPEEDTADVPIAGTPSYTIDKTVTDVAGKGTTANVTKAGDVISYQITVNNTGNVDLTNVTVNDTLIPNANLTGPIESKNTEGVLEVKESWIFTGNYTVTQADINSNGGGDGLINNTATVDSDQLPPEEDTAQVPIEKVPIEENPAYTIDKTVTDVAGKGQTANVTRAGDVITYQITVNNTGNVDLTNVTVTDSLIKNLTGPAGDSNDPSVLDVGETWIFTGNYTVTQTDINSNGGGDGLINNTATVDSDQLPPEEDTAQVPIEEIPIEENPAYTIEKTVTDVAGKGPAANVTKAGDIISYQINVTNTGNVDLTNITVNDTLIPDANLTGPTGDNAPAGVLDVGETWIFTGNYTATQADINNNGGGDGDIDNKATVDSKELEPLSDSEDVPVTQNPSYTIDKTVTDVAGKGSTGNVTKAGDIITYQINVTNTGNVDLTNITVNDTLIGNLTGPTGDSNDPDVLNVGETWNYTGIYTVTQTDINTSDGGDGLINNTATVDSDQLPPKEDTAQVPIEEAPIEENPAYTINKTVTDVAGKGSTGNVTKAGDVITYQINVTNTGNVDLTNATVTDPLLGTLTGPTADNPVVGVLDVGETWIFTGNYTATQEDINSNGGGDGLINNTAKVDSDQLPPKEDTADVPIEEIPIEENPAYTINKTVTDVAGKGPAGNVTKAGDVIGYRINVTNTGNIDLTNITVNDTLIPDANLTGPTGDNEPTGVLDVGETWIFTGNYTVTQVDINNNGGGDGDIDNKATVDSKELEPLSDSEDIPVTQNPSYTIDKTVTDVAGKGSTGNVTKAGDIITYQINVTNTGNVDLTNVTINDTLIPDANLTGPTGDNPVVGVLEVGESWIFTGNYTVTQEDINSNSGGDGLINNTATVDSDQLPPKEDTAQVPIEEIPIEENPAYTINKTVTDVAGKGPAGNVTKAGDVIGYRINVTNTGNVDLTNITLVDSLIPDVNLTGPTGDNAPAGVLDVGETWTYTGTYTVTQADINSNGGRDGLINNTATVDSDQLGPKSDNVEVPIEQKLEKPDYCIYKSIIGVDKAGDCIINEAGDIIEYQVAVKNIGKGNLTNVTVNDSLITLTGPTGDNINPGILNPGETWKYKGNYTVTQEDINTNGGGDGDIDNKATVSCNELPDENSTKEQKIVQTPDYCIYKSIIGVDQAGDCIINEPRDIIEYQIAVKNIGNVDLTGISVNDTLITLTGPTGDNIEPGVLNPGEKWKYKGNYTVTQADINSNGGGDGDIDNTATVSCNELPDENSSVQQPIAQKLDLCIYKSIIGADRTGDCIIDEAGDIIEYQIAVKNNGKGNLTNITVNDSLITLTKPTGDNIDPGILNPGETWKYKGNYTVTQEDINSNGGGDGDIDNTATVSCNELPDENSSKKQPIVQTPDYCIYKSIIGADRAGDCIINEAGDIIEYQIAVKNIGNVDLTGISVNDTLIELTEPTGDNIEPGVLNPGETWKYKGNYTVTQNDINSNGGGDGDIDNTATVSSNELPDENSSKEQLILLASTSTNNATPTPTDDVDHNGDDDSGDGGSSGGGGGGGGSPEPAGNIKVKELAQAFVTNGKEARFNFTKNATCVVYVSFDAKKTMGKITTTVEMLKGKSTLTPDAPEDEVYDYLNIWVGSGGYATEKNIENAVVCFKVEKTRMEEKGINESSITLNRYNDGKWSKLPVSLLKEDNKYLYFTAETPGFSPFAITGQTKNGLDADIRGTESESEISTSEEDTEYTESETEQKESQSTPGFELICGIVSLLAIFLYRRK